MHRIGAAPRCRCVRDAVIPQNACIARQDVASVQQDVARRQLEQLVLAVRVADHDDAAMAVRTRWKVRERAAFSRRPSTTRGIHVEAPRLCCQSTPRQPREPVEHGTPRSRLEEAKCGAAKGRDRCGAKHQDARQRDWQREHRACRVDDIVGAAAHDSYDLRAVVEHDPYCEHTAPNRGFLTEDKYTRLIIPGIYCDFFEVYVLLVRYKALSSRQSTTVHEGILQLSYSCTVLYAVNRVTQ